MDAWNRFEWAFLNSERVPKCDPSTPHSTSHDHCPATQRDTSARKASCAIFLHTSNTATMSNPHQFPNVRDKLSAPSKKSAFEKARLEAEEKRKREEAETAAVYKDFVASFDEGPSDAPPSSGFRGGFRAGGAGRRHFTGTRGPPPPALPPPGLRKRGLGDAFERDEEEGGVFGSGALTEREKRRLKEGSSGLLAFENSGPAKPRRYNAADDDSGAFVWGCSGPWLTQVYAQIPTQQPHIPSRRYSFPPSLLISPRLRSQSYYPPPLSNSIPSASSPPLHPRDPRSLHRQSAKPPLPS
jgi:hypothetical protein